MVKKTVVLPIHMKKQAEQFGRIAADLSGYPHGSPEYKQAYKDGVYEFCLDAYSKSMTPSGELGSNPRKTRMEKNATPRISLNSYKPLMGFIDDVNDEFSLNLSTADIRSYKRKLKGAITNISHVLLDMRFKLNNKRAKSGKKSPMEYKRKSGNTVVDERNLLHADLYRYLRLAFASMLAGFCEIMFRSRNIPLDFRSGSAFAQEVEGLIIKYIPEYAELKTDKERRALLLTKESRQVFASSVKDDMINSLKSGDAKVKRKSDQLDMMKIMEAEAPVVEADISDISPENLGELYEGFLEVFTKRGGKYTQGFMGEFLDEAITGDLKPSPKQRKQLQKYSQFVILFLKDMRKFGTEPHQFFRFSIDRIRKHIKREPTKEDRRILGVIGEAMIEVDWPKFIPREYWPE